MTNLVKDEHVHDESTATGTTTSFDNGAELVSTAQAMLGRQHALVPGLCRQAGASLGPTRRQNRATGAGPHAKPEAVGLGATAVVRLVRALAHC
jgi:hypothetical protein